MRLLKCNPNSDLVFHEFDAKHPPAYAILSHTWLAENEEVRFQDIKSGKGKSKAGWKKIDFCAEKAATDGLQYFWIDTCCINKENLTELSEAINSMFRWYHKATRCYVYLSDVSKPKCGLNNQSMWKGAFRKSRWFTRAWTLQELIAPAVVDFFSSEGEQLGDKSSLEALINKITGIAYKALRGDALLNFNINERKSWAEGRDATKEEDEIYALVGIFDVSLYPIYGEGKDKASRRLEEEIHKSYKGADFDQFAVRLNLLSMPAAAEFVAREEELIEMHQVLYGQTSRSTVVLHGLGGIGKTQLALIYTRRHKEKYTAIFWLDANDDNSLKLSFRNLAQQIVEDHPSTGTLASVDLDGNLDQVVTAVKTWLDLRQNTRWLMIYDNYDNPKTAGNSDRSAVDVRRFLPRSDQGSIIITTRSSQVNQGHRVHVQKLSCVQEGLEILSKASGRENIAGDAGAVELAKELDGLPLALSTAGAYLEHVTTSFSDYLRLYRASWLDLQTTSPQLSSYEDRSLYTTWQITLSRIQQQNPASAKLLKLWAYFDRQDVWFGLLRHAKSADDELIQELTDNELSYNRAVRLLCNYGLVDPDRPFQHEVGSGGYSVHSCVHSWTVFVLNMEGDDGMARLALTCVASENPLRDARNSWILQRRLFQHAARQEQLIEDGKVDLDGMEWALHSLGALYADQGKLAEAEHTSTLDTVNNLGILYADQGKLAEAEVMYDRALQGYEEALSPEYISYLPALNTMFVFGDLYLQTERKELAKAMYTQALSGYTTVQGPSSKWCKQLEGRLRALQLIPVNLKPCQDESIELGAQELRSLKQKIP
ncbi:HET-domain-containing protein [Viridothelium virens]|uniref:HET-domain-containing protein n=1 Tax=Viridothelium virens TaxID=1048519 RepID=A0A6A6GT13_VIRVR|nr:HET-domain-containing protein [Viridothelium virens]